MPLNSRTLDYIRRSKFGPGLCILCHHDSGVTRQEEKVKGNRTYSYLFEVSDDGLCVAGDHANIQNYPSR